MKNIGRIVDREERMRHRCCASADAEELREGVQDHWIDFIFSEIRMEQSIMYQ
jgi:hypothetical protein